MDIRIGLLCVALATAAPSWARGLVPVEVIREGSGMLGEPLVAAFKQGLDASEKLHAATEPGLGFRVLLKTRDSSTADGSNVVVYAATWAWNNPDNKFAFAIDNSVGICDAQDLTTCAADLVTLGEAALSRVEPYLIPVPETAGSTSAAE